MPFSDILDNDLQKNILIRAMASERLHHSYLFVGPPGCGKETMAFGMAKALMCRKIDKNYCGQCPACIRITEYEHPDLKYIFPITATSTEEDIQAMLESKKKGEYTPSSKNLSITINQIRKLKNDLRLTPFESDKKVVIIRDIDTMTIPASNSFLKLLEEPPLDTVIFATIDNNALQRVLPTILSRFIKINFSKLSRETVKNFLIKKFGDSADNNLINLASSLCDGNLEDALGIVNGDMLEYRNQTFSCIELALRNDPVEIIEKIQGMNLGKERHKMELIYRWLLSWFRDLLTLSHGGPDELLYNRDMRGQIAGQLPKYTHEDIVAILGNLNEKQRMIENNVNLSLLFLVTLFELVKSR